MLLLWQYCCSFSFINSYWTISWSSNKRISSIQSILGSFYTGYATLTLLTFVWHKLNHLFWYTQDFVVDKDNMATNMGGNSAEEPNMQVIYFSFYIWWLFYLTSGILFWMLHLFSSFSSVSVPLVDYWLLLGLNGFIWRLELCILKIKSSLKNDRTFWVWIAASVS